MEPNEDQVSFPPLLGAGGRGHVQLVVLHQCAVCPQLHTTGRAGSHAAPVSKGPSQFPFWRCSAAFPAATVSTGHTLRVRGADV